MSLYCCVHQVSDDEEELNVKKIPCTMPVLCSWYKEIVEVSGADINDLIYLRLGIGYQLKGPTFPLPGLSGSSQIIFRYTLSDWYRP